MWIYKGEIATSRAGRPRRSEFPLDPQEKPHHVMPKKVKFRKQQRGRRRGIATRGAEDSFGDFGLQALEAGWVTARQIEAAVSP